MPDDDRRSTLDVVEEIKRMVQEQTDTIRQMCADIRHIRDEHRRADDPQPPQGKE